MTTFSAVPLEVIPAIDLRDGRCVRLTQGDFQQETIYSDDPAAMARRWQDLGATRLHVVDLDGAAGGEPRNLPAIRAILAAVRLPVQVGGGIRSLEIAGSLLALGVARVVFGTVAVRKPELIAAACREFGADAVVVGVDARSGHVAVSGWTQQEPVLATDLADQMAQLGVQRFIYTDIGRDGTLSGPNVQALTGFRSAVRTGSVIASGGVGKVEDIRELRGLGVEGIIIGRALYTGDVDLAAALQAASAAE